MTRPAESDPSPPAFLHERFPPLADTVPRLILGDGPTPVRELRAAGGEGEAVWVKEDGGYGAPVGGNKARKLEWTLADALGRGRSAIVTIGALGTNHGLATAIHAREHGLRTVLLLVDQPVDEAVRRQLERLERSGALIYRTRGAVRTAATLPWAMLRHADLRAGRLPYFLTVGGSSPLGSLGYVEAAFELARQVEAGELPEPAHAVVALGSGGTAAGLAVGLRLAGLRTRVVAIVVSDKLRLTGRRVARLGRRTLALLRRRGADLPAVSLSAGDLAVEDRWLGGGYGHPTPDGERALELAGREGLTLDPVYTAKAMAALLELRREGALGPGPVLFWNTYGPPPRSIERPSAPIDRAAS